MNALGAGVVLVAESRDDEHEEAHEETNLLHHLAAVKLVVNEERGKVVTSQRHSNVDQIPGPVGHEGVGVVRNDLDELTLEELVSVEKDVIAEPSTSSSKQTTTKVGEAVLESSHVVASNIGSVLGLRQLLGSVGHLPSSVVNEPKSTNGGECERQAECILGS